MSQTRDYASDDETRPMKSGHALLRLAVDVRRGEVAAMLLSALYFFCLMAAYYPLRNFRDVIGSLGGAEGLSELYTATFIVMLLAVPAFSWLVTRVPRRVFLPLVYHFFALNLIGFYVLFKLMGESWATQLRIPLTPWTIRGDTLVFASYFVWVSVFNLFVVSVFWGFMADLWRNDQGKRLFGFIGAGASLGAMFGAGMSATLAQRFGSYQLLLIAVGLLEAAVLCIWMLRRVERRSQQLGGQQKAARDEAEPVRGSWWEAFSAVVRSPYLIGIASWVLFYTGTNTLLYFIQAELVNATFTSRDARTSFFGSVDLAMNSLAFLISLTLTGRVMSKLGVALTLMILPLTTLLGFGALWLTYRMAPGDALLWGMGPLVWVFVAVRVVRSGSHYALAKPAKEVLFTVVSRAEKYKAKVFIDTAIYRGGDVGAAWVLEALRRIAGLMALTLAGIPLAIAWMGLALWLGRAQRKRAALAEAPPRGFEPGLPAGAPSSAS